MPPASCFAQWEAQLSHSRWQSEHALAQASIPWSWASAAVGAARVAGAWARNGFCNAPKVTAVRPATVKSLRPIMIRLLAVRNYFDQQTPNDFVFVAQNHRRGPAANGRPGVAAATICQTWHSSDRRARANTPAGPGLRSRSGCSSARWASSRSARAEFLRRADDRHRSPRRGRACWC